MTVEIGAEQLDGDNRNVVPYQQHGTTHRGNRLANIYTKAYSKIDHVFMH